MLRDKDGVTVGGAIWRHSSQRLCTLCSPERRRASPEIPAGSCIAVGWGWGVGVKEEKIKFKMRSRVVGVAAC